MKVIAASTLIATTLLSVSVSAATLNQGDILLKVGAVTVAPDVTSTVPTLNGDSLAGIADGVDVNDDTQLGLSGTYMFSSNWGLEVLAATPFKHDITIDGGATNGTPVGTTKHLPPTISAQYYFMGHTASKFQPYVGVGVNYTNFFQEDVDPEFISTLNTLNLGLDSGELTLKDSWGIAAQAGLDYYINDKLFVNASVMWADISTEAQIDLKPAGQILVDADLDPWVYRINVGYKF